MCPATKHGLLVVGLTGGIASGKSTVAQMFQQLDIAVVDADVLARETTAETRPRIVQEFGSGILDAQGELDRAALGRIVFADTAARQRLEAITHPAIAAAALARFERLASQGRSLVIYEAALLVETGRHQEMDRLIVVVADDEVRIDRLMARSGLSRAEAGTRLAAQLPQQRKADLADYLIDNSGLLEQTRARVSEVWQALQVVIVGAPSRDGFQEKR